MADTVKISELPKVESAKQTDLLVIDQASATSSITLGDAMHYQYETDELHNLGQDFPNYPAAQGTKGKYSTDAMDEATFYYNGGDWTGDRPTVAPVVCETQFRFMDASTAVNSWVPHKTPASSEWIIPLCGIESLMSDSPVAPMLFSNIETYGTGVTKFRYEGARSLHGILRGSLKYLVRVSLISDEARRLAGGTPIKPGTAWLYLKTPDETPPAESQDRYTISVCNNWRPFPMYKLHNRGTGTSLPYKTWEELETLLASEPAITHTVVPGAIPGNSVSETLDTSNAATRTTSWMPVGGETVWWVSPQGGTSSACRVQFKDKEGRIWYDNEISSGTASSKKLILIHQNAVYVRFYFKNGADTCTDVLIKALPDRFDPYYGYWAEYDFHVNQTVNFEPGFAYNFSIQFFNYYATALDTNGWLLATGGLSLLTNARQVLQQNLANQLEV